MKSYGNLNMVFDSFHLENELDIQIIIIIGQHIQFFFYIFRSSDLVHIIINYVYVCTRNTNLIKSIDYNNKCPEKNK